MDLLLPAVTPAAISLRIVDVLVLGGLSSAIVALLVLIVVYGERRAAPKARPKAKTKGPQQHVTVVHKTNRRHGPSEDPEDDITLITVSIAELQREEEEAKAKQQAQAQQFRQAATQRIAREDDTDRAIPIVADPGAEADEPTRNTAMILVSAAGQTDVGKRRERNEDRFAVLEEEQLYVVADGMGGYAGGQIASQIACDTIVSAFKEQDFQGTVDEHTNPGTGVPPRGAELALAVQMANRAIWQRSLEEPELKGMGTTVVCARFAPKKRRLYIGHVGDSRCYRLRDGQLVQLTEDHTMSRFGITGRHGQALSRAVGIGPGVNVDLIIAEPRVDDIYLLCSDGLTKMVKEDREIRDIVMAHRTLEEAVNALVTIANDRGGKDNVTVVLVGIKDAAGLRRAYSLTPVSQQRVENP